MWGLRKERSHEDWCKMSDGQRNIRVADGAGKLTAARLVFFLSVSSFAPVAQVWAPAWTTSRQSRSLCTPPQRQVRPTMQTNSAAFSTASGLDSANTRWVYFLIFRSTFTEFFQYSYFFLTVYFLKRSTDKRLSDVCRFYCFCHWREKRFHVSVLKNFTLPPICYGWSSDLSIYRDMSTEVGFDLHCQTAWLHLKSFSSLEISAYSVPTMWVNVIKYTIMVCNTLRSKVSVKQIRKCLYNDTGRWIYYTRHYTKLERLYLLAGLGTSRTFPGEAGVGPGSAQGAVPATLDKRHGQIFI